MDLNHLIFNLIEILLPVFVLSLIVFIGYGVALFKKKVEKIDNEIAKGLLLAALHEAESVGIDAVHSTNQVFVDSIREKSKNGRLTKDEAKQAMELAKDYFVSHITSGSLRILESSLGPVCKWLEGFLEAKLSTEK